MKKIPYNKFKHGQRVTCEIGGETIKDAKISIEVPHGSIYICQNRKKGQKADDLMGYKHSWKIVYKNEDFYDGKEQVENLQFLPRTLDDLEERDVVVNVHGDELEVQGVCGKVYFLSSTNNFNITGNLFTLQELKKDGYTLKQEEEKLEFRESTEEEKKITDNPILKIPADEQTIIYKGKTYILSK